MAHARSRTSYARSLRAAAIAAVLALGVVACSGSSGPGGLVPPGSRSPSAGPRPPALAVAHSLPFSAPATFKVTGATIGTATVTGHVHGTPLPGHVEADGATWVSDELPVAGAAYDVQTVVSPKTGGGQETLTGSFTVTKVPSSQELHYSVTPFQGWTVGVNAPIVVRFDKTITDRAAVERALTVMSSVPVTGSWHWVGSAEVHFRPQGPWPAHTRIRFVAALRGVKAGPTVWGTTSETVDFSTGDVHLTKVDGLRHTLSVYVNGRHIATWPTSLGRPEFATRTGNYVVLSKQPTRRMTSCNAHITCDKANPNWYDLEVDFDVRLTYSGTFIHSAPWSVRHQGVDNVSHGCINLSPSHATTYFNLSRYGDLVTVTGTSRNANDLVSSGDPGMADWNLSWSRYVAGSALGAAITTQPL